MSRGTLANMLIWWANAHPVTAIAQPVRFHLSVEPSSYLRLAACIQRPTSSLRSSLEPLSSLRLGPKLLISLRPSLKQLSSLCPGLVETSSSLSHPGASLTPLDPEPHLNT